MEICRHKGLRLSEVADRIGSGQSNLVTSVKGSQKTAAKTGILETLEFFSLVYDHNAGRFTLSLCYAKGEIATMVYDKLEYCDWREDDTEETVQWNLPQVTRDIINDHVSCHLPQQGSPYPYLYNYFGITLGDLNTCCVYIVN